MQHVRAWLLFEWSLKEVSPLHSWALLQLLHPTCCPVRLVAMLCSLRKPPHLFVCRSRIETPLINCNITPETLFPSPDPLHRYLSKRFRDSLVQAVKGEVAVGSGVPLGGPPKVLDNVEFAVVFREEDALVASCVDDFFDGGGLGHEVGLDREELV